MNYDVIWKSDWFVGVMVSLLFVIGISTQLSQLRGVDRFVYDTTSHLNSHPADSRFVIVDVDSKNNQQSDIASAIEKLSNAGAKTISLDILYREPESPTPQAEGSTQDPLSENIRLAGNVFLPLYFQFGETSKQSNLPAPDFLSRAALKQINQNSTEIAPSNAFLLRYPYQQLSAGAAGFGHFNLITDPDNRVRTIALATEYSGRFYPSMALTLAAASMNIPLSDIRLNLGRDIELGALNVSVDQKLRIYPAFHSDGSGNSYTHYPLSRVVSGRTSPSLFKDKIVLIGTPANSSANSFSTPVSENMSRSEFVAHALQSILKEESIIRPGWAYLLEFGLFLIACFYLIFLLPRLSAVAGLITTSITIVLLLASEFLFISLLALWIQTGVASLLLLMGQIGISLKQYLVIKEKQPTTTINPNETNKMLGLSFQSQGMLEKAYEKFLTCPINDELLSILYDLALAFERKRQFDEAINVYQYMASHDSSYRDIQTRIISARNANDSLSDKGSNAGISSLLASGDNKPTLGRYEIVSELGKGAMGTVYLGRDPKINRQVAIKTLALSKEFEPDQLEEVKERFFHEAEIAGMLNHPNIVTIFDAGDEHDLAYIAMEFLDGIDLIPYTRKGKTLPISTTLKIIAKVTEALQYAHNHGVIHRDIKPANIMILKNKTVKVTDFGIAHITESNKGKAGTVLGTPSYMSPEQLSGKPIDGRSDLFSLGVMLYEMVAGVRPFKAASISKLMFKIAKEPHKDVRELNPDTPDNVAELINALLTKKADQRIGSAKEVLDRIQLCLHENRTNGGV